MYIYYTRVVVDILENSFIGLVSTTILDRLNRSFWLPADYIYIIIIIIIRRTFNKT